LRAHTTTPALTWRSSAAPRRPQKGFAPTLMARKIATFDHLTNERLAVHIITGKTDDEQQGDGDFSPKTERYRRAAEYLELMKLAWSSESIPRTG
jgi:alkanesulfonate monooxygenase SsuD/methylene tetrahydromethanopterin reductase-like flavin-dependent oxidoreductase (luciferase family)